MIETVPAMYPTQYESRILPVLWQGNSFAEWCGGWYGSQDGRMWKVIKSFAKSLAACFQKQKELRFSI